MPELDFSLFPDGFQGFYEGFVARLPEDTEAPDPMELYHSASDLICEFDLFLSDPMAWMTYKDLYYDWDDDDWDDDDDDWDDDDEDEDEDIDSENWDEPIKNSDSIPNPITLNNEEEDDDDE